MTGGPSANLPGLQRLKLSAPVLLLTLSGGALAGCERSTKAPVYSLYAGGQTDNSWTDPFVGKVDFAGSPYIGYSVTKPLFKAGASGDFGGDFGIEVMAGGYTGTQNHTEAVAMVSYDHYKFPWSKTVDTRFSAGLGWSVHDRVSVVEWQRTFCNQPPSTYVYPQGDCAPKHLPYWKLELGVAVPKTDGQLTLNLRLHHRSPAFKSISEEGGGNALLLGLRYQPNRD